MLLAHPSLPSCSCCETFLFKKAGGELVRKANGDPQERDLALQPTPCSGCPKVPAWAKAKGLGWRELRTHAAELTPENRAALEAYRECKATGRFPADALSDWYSGVIRRAEDEEAAARQTQSAEAVGVLVKLVAEEFSRRLARRR